MSTEKGVLLRWKWFREMCPFLAQHTGTTRGTPFVPFIQRIVIKRCIYPRGWGYNTQHNHFQHHQSNRFGVSMVPTRWQLSADRDSLLTVSGFLWLFLHFDTFPGLVFKEKKNGHVSIIGQILLELACEKLHSVLTDRTNIRIWFMKIM